MYFQCWSCESFEHCKHLTILNIWAFEHFEPGRGVGSIAALSRACGRSPFPPVASWGWRKSNICIFCIFHFSFCIMDFAFASRIWIFFEFLHFTFCMLYFAFARKSKICVSPVRGWSLHSEDPVSSVCKWLKISYCLLKSGWKYRIVYLKVAENNINY